MRHSTAWLFIAFTAAYGTGASRVEASADLSLSRCYAALSRVESSALGEYRNYLGSNPAPMDITPALPSSILPTQRISSMDLDEQFPESYPAAVFEGSVVLARRYAGKSWLLVWYNGKIFPFLNPGFHRQQNQFSAFKLQISSSKAVHIDFKYSPDMTPTDTDDDDSQASLPVIYTTRISPRDPTITRYGKHAVVSRSPENWVNHPGLQDFSLREFFFDLNRRAMLQTKFVNAYARARLMKQIEFSRRTPEDVAYLDAVMATAKLLDGWTIPALPLCERGLARSFEAHSEFKGAWGIRKNDLQGYRDALDLRASETREKLGISH